MKQLHDLLTSSKFVSKDAPFWRILQHKVERYCTQRCAESHLYKNRNSRRPQSHLL